MEEPIKQDKQEQLSNFFYRMDNYDFKEYTVILDRSIDCGNASHQLTNFNIGLPTKSGVYFFGSKDQVIYIGSTKNFKIRMGTHCRNGVISRTGIKKVYFFECNNPRVIENNLNKRYFGGYHNPNDYNGSGELWKRINNLQL